MRDSQWKGRKEGKGDWPSGFGAGAGSGSGSGTGLNLPKVLRHRGQIPAWVVWSYWELSLKSWPLCCSVPSCPSVTLKTPLTLRWWQNAFFCAAAELRAGIRVCSDAEAPFTNSRRGVFFFSFSFKWFVHYENVSKQETFDGKDAGSCPNKRRRDPKST